ncbi:MAG: hypothetical protein ACP5NY_09455, partial [Thermocladium sp.]
AMFLRYSQELGLGVRGLIVTTLAHAYMDSYVEALNYLAAFGAASLDRLYWLTAIMWSTALAISICFMIIGHLLIRGIASRR